MQLLTAYGLYMLFQWAIGVGLVQNWHYLIKMPWYWWKIAHSALKDNHSFTLTHSTFLFNLKFKKKMFPVETYKWNKLELPVDICISWPGSYIITSFIYHLLVSVSFPSISQDSCELKTKETICILWDFCQINLTYLVKFE